MSRAVSIIVPCLDEPLVGRTLAALAEQPGIEDAEVLVVGRDPYGAVDAARVGTLVETSERLNPAAARNHGVSKSTGELLVFTDADCAPLSSWLPRMRRALETSPIVGGAVRFDLEANYWAVADNIASFHPFLEDRPAEDRSSHPVGTLNLALRRDVWEAVGPFDEELVTSEDFDWCLRAVERGFDVAFVPEAVVEHAAVRDSRESLEGHAAWYGRHFPEFRHRHPGVFDRGPTWRNRTIFKLSAPAKALVSAAEIFWRHPSLRPAWRTFPGVVAFKRAWYRAVAEAWKT